jgi:hypothetical protein
MRTLKNSQWSRRSLIQGLGIGAASLGLQGRALRKAAAASSIPTRFVVFTGSGMINDDCWPTGIGGAAPTETAWNLGEVHAPLAPFKQKCLYVDGISMVARDVDPNMNQGNAHDQGTMHAFAAASTTKPGQAGGPSIDQVIAQAFNKPNPVTKLPSLQLLMGYWAGDLGNTSFSSQANTYLPMDWDPREAYKRVFGDFVAPSAGMGPSLADIQAKQQLKVLGLAGTDFTRLSSRLGSEDRKRLDVHRSLLSDLEKRMQLMTPANSGPSCAPPTVLSKWDNCVFSCWNQQQANNYTLSSDYNARIAAASLACDLTRVVGITLQVPDQLTSYKPNAFGYGDGDLHGLVHQVCDRATPASKLLAARQPVKDANLVEAKTVANFCSQLAQIPEADGSSVLDHTIVLWGGHIGYGSHDLNRLPWVVIGGGATGLNLGRYIKLPPDAKYKNGRPHNDYLMTLAKAAGVNLSTFGNPQICSGLISQMLA